MKAKWIVISLSMLTCGELSVSHKIHAQIVIPESQLMQIGMNHNVGITDFGQMEEFIFTDLIPRGNNVVWNFNTLQPAIQQNLKVVTVLDAPFGQNLLGNKVLLRNNGEVNSQYLLAANDALFTTGHINSEGLELPYSPGELIAMFPLTVGQSFEGEFLDQITFYVGEPLQTAYVVDSVRRNTITTYEYTVNSYGTLHLPHGSHEVVMQEVFRHITSVADFLRQDTQEWVLGADVSEIDERELIFWGNNAGCPLLRLRDIGDVGIIIDLEWIHEQTLSTTPSPIRSADLKIYPNPANDLVTFSAEGLKSYTVEVYNITGELVKIMPGNYSAEQLDISDLPAGTYIARAITEEMTMAEKFMVIR